MWHGPECPACGDEDYEEEVADDRGAAMTLVCHEIDELRRERLECTQRESEVSQTRRVSWYRCTVHAVCVIM
jgi:hypothetical protein